MRVNIPIDVPKSKEKEYIKNFKLATCGTGRMMMMAGDQKVEHLNDDFVGRGIPEEVADPEHYFKIADKAKIGVFATQLGLIAQYGRDYPNIPYLIKVNSRTNLFTGKYGDPFSNRWVPMDGIIKFKKESGLNVVGVGYTIYIGSSHESEMFSQGARIVHDVHCAGMLAVIWMYPRGKAVKNENDIHLLAGGAGVATCLGADFVKTHYPYGGNNKKTVNAYKEVVNAAGRTGVICVGGNKKETRKFLKNLHDQIHIAGTRGHAIGRNIYQRPLDEAVRMANAISAISLYDYSAEDAYSVFLGKKKIKNSCQIL